MLKKILSLISILDKISTYLYEKRLIQQGANEAERKALLEARKAEKAADRALRNPSIIKRLQERYRK